MSENSNTNENSNITEQEYLELSNQLKESYELYENKNKILEEENEQLKKDIMCIYGLIRTIDNFYENFISTTNGNHELQFLIETTRGFLSGILDAHILF